MTDILGPIPDSPFRPDTKLQFAWDATSLMTFMECPRKYQLRILEGWVTRSPNRQIALDFGILMHRGVELFHKYSAEKAGVGRHAEIVHWVLRAIMQDPLFAKLPTPEEMEAEVAEAKEDEDADESSIKVSKVRTRFHLLRALMWYFEHYARDPLRVVHLKDGSPAVELSFRVPTNIKIAGEDVIYCGHMDRVVHYADSLIVADLKTTGKSLGSAYFRLFDINYQMTGYTFAGRMILDKPVQGAMIDGVSLLVGGVKFGRGPTHRSKSQIAEWLGHLGRYAEEAERFHDEDFYPMNTTSCRFCEFLGICSKPPEVRQLYLSQRFQRGAGWNPLANR